MIQIDMEMPKSCSKCPLFNGEFGECQHLGFNVNNAIKTDFTEERELNCPLKEVPNGEWIERDDGWGDNYYDCSVCGESWATIDGTPFDNGMKYCPNCGAKMEQTGENE